MTADLYFCLLCPTQHKDPVWVGDFDAIDLYGECPKCRISVGIFPVETDGFPYDDETRTQIAAVVKAGNVDHLDPVTA